MKRLLLACVAVAALAGPAQAQIPVTDSASIMQRAAEAARALDEAIATKQRIEMQLQTAQQQLASMQRLTDVSGIASGLNGLRNPFGGSASGITGLLQGNGTGGVLGSILPNILGRNEVYRNPNEGFYATEQNRRRQAIAAQQAASEKLLGEAQERTSHLEELRERLATARDPAEKQDLIARVGYEQAQLQNISIQAAAVRDFAQAEERSFDQRKREAMQQEIDDAVRGLEAERGSRASRGWLSAR